MPARATLPTWLTLSSAATALPPVCATAAAVKHAARPIPKAACTRVKPLSADQNEIPSPTPAHRPSGCLPKHRTGCACRQKQPATAAKRRTAIHRTHPDCVLRPRNRQRALAASREGLRRRSRLPIQKPERHQHPPCPRAGHRSRATAFPQRARRAVRVTRPYYAPALKSSLRPQFGKTAAKRGTLY